MLIGGTSFWQQNQVWRKQARSRSNFFAQSNAVNSVMSNAMMNLSSGLAAIANQQALNRVNAQLTAAVQSALKSGALSSGSGSSSTTSSASSSSSKAKSTATSAAPVSNSAAMFANNTSTAVNLLA